MNKAFEIQQLVRDLNEYTRLYDEGHPVISDKEWDRLYFKLEQLEKETGLIYPDSPTNTISYQVVNKLNKVTHNHKMLSLAKTKIAEDVVKWGGNNKLIAMSKLDGLTCSLTYKNGSLVAAETRGDGLVGEDIFHNAVIISSIPNKLPKEYEDRTIVIDGEIICNDYDFKLFEKEYKNSRNFASGSIRLLDSFECSKRHLTFVAWDIIQGYDNLPTLSKKLEQLRELGFLVPAWNKDIPSDKEIIENVIADIRKESYSYGYPIDGVVFKIDDCKIYNSLGATDHHFRGGLAYKFYDEEVKSHLLDIEWSMGRTGSLTPVAIFEPVELEGTTISRASLHNISIMDDLWSGTWHAGLTVSVIKANQIIPQISKVEEECQTCAKWLYPPTFCPICGASTLIEVSDSGVKTLVCTNEMCDGKLINRLDHFCGKKGLDIKGLSKATLEKFIDKGWINEISDIFMLKEHKTEMENLAGFGVKSVSNILAAIEDSRTCSLESFLSALGIPLIGKAMTKVIAKKVDNSWEKYYQLVQNKFDFSSWEDFGTVKSENMLNFNYTIAKRLIDDGVIIIQSTETTVEKSAETCKNLIFCVTGKLTHFNNRNQLIEFIEQRGGKVASSVTKKTNFLINNDTTSATAKNKTAMDLNIPILSEDEFLKKFS